jgi:hypothetical protein
VPPGHEQAWDEIRRIAEAQRANADRISELLIRHRAYEVGSKPFPVEFTSYNDLSLEFLLQPLIDYERFLISNLEQSLGILDADEEGRLLVQRILGSERNHLDRLLRLIAAAPKHERHAA